MLLIVLVSNAVGAYGEGFVTWLAIPEYFVVSPGQDFASGVHDGELHRIHAVAKEVVIVDAASAEIDRILFAVKFLDPTIQLAIVVVVLAVSVIVVSL
ncbi:hypothetical protein WL00_34705 [Burkholderia cepacia]|nr:hypothetical protein WL00_34705 [Burkholderia cepacia]KVX68697.1 hypothetical protein WL07_24515 [Burkholderia cepacia]